MRVQQGFHSQTGTGIHGQYLNYSLSFHLQAPKCIDNFRSGNLVTWYMNINRHEDILLSTRSLRNNNWIMAWSCCCIVNYLWEIDWGSMFQQVRDNFLTVWQRGLDQRSCGIIAFAIFFTVSNTVTDVQFLYVAVCWAYKEPCNWTRN